MRSTRVCAPMNDLTDEARQAVIVALKKMIGGAFPGGICQHRKRHFCEDLPARHGDRHHMKTGPEPSEMTDEQLDEAIHRLDLALREFLDASRRIQREGRAVADQIAASLHELLTERETRKRKRRSAMGPSAPI